MTDDELIASLNVNMEVPVVINTHGGHELRTQEVMIAAIVNDEVSKWDTVLLDGSREISISWAFVGFSECNLKASIWVGGHDTLTPVELRIDVYGESIVDITLVFDFTKDKESNDESLNHPESHQVEGNT